MPRPGTGHLTDVRPGRFSSVDYLSQVARAAEVAGFDGVHLPHEPDGEDPLIIAPVLARKARRLTILPELHAAFATPVYAAKLAVTFQRFSGGLLAWKLVGVDGGPLRAYGDTLAGDDRVARAEEFLDIARGVWAGAPFSYEGRFYVVSDGGLADPLLGWPFPEVHLTGESARALALSARHADVHLFRDTRIDVLPSRIERLRAVTDRPVRIGVQLSVVARETEAEAIDAAGPGGADLVGSYPAVADRIRAYEQTGVERFVLAARPSLEEAYRFGERVLPLLTAVPV